MAATVHEPLDVAAACDPGRCAIITRERTVDYGQLADETARAATWLASTGVGRGDRVAVLLPNCIEVVVVALAASRLGAIFVVLNDQIKPFQLADVLADAAPRVLLTVPDRTLPSLPEDLRLLTLDEYASEVPRASPWEASFPGITTDPVCLAYTSGSTAAPKGVVSTHRHVAFATQTISATLGLGRPDVIGVFLPLAFDYGLYQLFLALGVGATIALGRPSDPVAGLLHQIVEWRVTVLPLVPPLATALLRLASRPGAPRPRLRLITNTGARLAPDVVDDLKAAFPGCQVFVMFGLTECKRVSILLPEEFVRKRDSVGKPLPDTECLIVDDEGHVLPPGQVGELVVRGPHVMSGYWNAPELSARRFRPFGGGLEHALWTGDRCWLDADGYLYFEGRSDDLYKSRGLRVSGTEVEIAASDVTGVSEVALLPPADGRGAVLVFSGSASAADVLSGLRERLEDYKMPESVMTIERMPLTTNGKIDRRALAECL